MNHMLRPPFHRFLPIASIASLCVLASCGGVNADPVNMCGKPSLEDRAEILDLIARYGPYIDYREAKPWASLFTEDGELNYPKFGDTTGAREVVKGRDALVAFASQSSAPNLVFAHYPGQTILVSVRTDQVKALTPVATAMVKTNAQLAANYNGLGVYEDVIVKTANGWRFRSRSANIYAALPMSRDFLPCNPATM
ncbi:nuclear transport factor 2 family protein [Noviherbaspirillum saxi]|uniref:Nuclear transport factor 2 family protein n=1 Tax=Noviherbaspirillum saxi TaxID=2320863 RepID=A0A3A3FGQ5_9BURK|nr:nuclear transport factor 2 family protein [Noviherbaspirillum saxi]RJF92571.1 nuclear transport factor 2 family protein [Noviherbaspirillum saxi]